MEKTKQKIAICVSAVFISIFIPSSQPMNSLDEPYFEHESVHDWAQSMDRFFRSFNKKARLSGLSKPVPLKEKEVLDIFRNHYRGESPIDLDELSRHFISLCKKYKFDPGLILSVIFVESRFDPEAISPVGARGLMQIMPITAQYISDRTGVLYEDIEDLYDPFLSLTMGVYYLSYLRTKFNNNIYLTLMAYNMGPSRILNRLNQGVMSNSLDIGGRSAAGDSRSPNYYELILNALEKFSFESS